MIPGHELLLFAMLWLAVGLFYGRAWRWVEVCEVRRIPIDQVYLLLPPALLFFSCALTLWRVWL